MGNSESKLADNDKIDRFSRVVEHCALGIDASERSGSDILTVLSFNIRYDNPGDKKNGWPNRKFGVTETVVHHKADIVGFQEVTPWQHQYLQKSLGSEYELYGVPREFNHVTRQYSGEASPIAWRKDRFRCLDQGTFWLNESGDRGEKGWDAACTRICSWVRLGSRTVAGRGEDFDKDSKDKEPTILVFNTHLDHMGGEAIPNSLELIRKQILTQLAKNETVVLTGDFNRCGDNPAMLDFEKEAEGSLSLKNCAHSAEKKAPKCGSFNFWKMDKKKSWTDIDYVFAQHKCLFHGVLIQKFSDGMTVSDHHPVCAILKSDVKFEVADKEKVAK